MRKRCVRSNDKKIFMENRKNKLPKKIYNKESRKIEFRDEQDARDSSSYGDAYGRVVNIRFHCYN